MAQPLNALASVAAEAWDAVQALKGVFSNPGAQGFGSEQLDYIAKTFGIGSGSTR